MIAPAIPLEDPEYRRRRAAEGRIKRLRAKRAEAALEREEDMRTRKGRMKEEGGHIAEVYSLIRRALHEAQAAHDAATNPDKRKAIDQTMRRLHQAEDAIAQAVKSSIYAGSSHEF